MDGNTYASYFLEPETLAHRRYETLRAVCVDELSMQEAAQVFGINYGTVRNWYSEFCRMRNSDQTPPFSPHPNEDDV